MTGMDLAEFLFARIAEDEAEARIAREITPVYDLEPKAYEEMLYLARGEGSAEQAAAHAERWDPARVLTECEAKRRVIELHGRTDGMGHKPDDGSSYGDMSCVCTSCGTPDEYGTRWPCRTLRALAMPYTDHPAYDESWRP